MKKLFSLLYYSLEYTPNTFKLDKEPILSAQSKTRRINLSLPEAPSHLKTQKNIRQS